MHKPQVEAEIKQAQRLIGARVMAVCNTPDFSSFGLQFRCGKKTVVAWVDCDPEGNGPGHLNLEEKQ